ncbi:MAG: hypothetical protein LBS86_05360, partial [Treponema sp.]|nr:hypothetical protein [Treponema sp.]
MTELHPNMLFEITRGLISIAGWWVLFYKLHRPPSPLRRVAQLVSFVVGYTGFMLIPLTDTGNAVLWAAMLFCFALLSGNLRSSLFTAMYYIGIEANIDITRSFCIAAIFKSFFKGYTNEYYLQFNVQYLVVLMWTLFYYRIVKDQKRTIPLHFWIMTLIPPFATIILLTNYADTARPLLAMGTNIYYTGILFGCFLFAINLFTFYMYLRLLTYYDSHLKAQSLRSQLDVYSHQIELIEGAQKQASEIRHEIKNILFALQIELEKQNYAEAQARISKVVGELKRYEQKPYTGVSVIDAMIAYK